MEPIGIRCGRWIGVTLLTLGLMVTALSLLARGWSGSLVGASLAVAGGLALSRPMIVVRPDAVELKNILGITMKTVPIRGLGDLQLDDNLLRRVSDGRRIRNLRFGGAHPEDAAVLARAISRDQAPAGRFA